MEQLKTSEAGIYLIKSCEACKLKAYVCPAGVLTIGYGHTGPDVFEGMEITQEVAETLLHLDLARFEAAVSKACPSLKQKQFDACVSLAYNIGAGAFAKSSVARLHNAGDYAGAAQAFNLWNKAGGKVSRGLQLRRAREAALYLEDEIENSEDYVPPSTATGEAPLSKSRTINGQAGAAVATAATVAASRAPTVDLDKISEHSDLLVSLLPYLQQYWWVFAGAAAAFLGLSMYARVQDRLAGRN